MQLRRSGAKTNSFSGGHRTAFVLCDDQGNPWAGDASELSRIMDSESYRAVEARLFGKQATITASGQDKWSLEVTTVFEVTEPDEVIPL